MVKKCPHCKSLYDEGAFQCTECKKNCGEKVNIEKELPKSNFLQFVFIYFVIIIIISMLVFFAVALSLVNFTHISRDSILFYAIISGLIVFLAGLIYIIDKALWKVLLEVLWKVL